MHDLIALVADVFLARVVDGAVSVKALARNRVEAALVGVERGLAVNVAEQDFLHRVAGRMLNVERTNRAAALNQSNNGALDRTGLALQVRTALALRRRRLIVFLADVGFVGFNGFAFTTERA